MVISIWQQVNWNFLLAFWHPPKVKLQSENGSKGGGEEKGRRTEIETEIKVHI